MGIIHHFDFLWKTTCLWITLNYGIKEQWSYDHNFKSEIESVIPLPPRRLLMIMSAPPERDHKNNLKIYYAIVRSPALFVSLTYAARIIFRADVASQWMDAADLAELFCHPHRRMHLFYEL